MKRFPADRFVERARTRGGERRSAAKLAEIRAAATAETRRARDGRRAARRARRE
jgi:hypothetical protein